MLVSRRCLLSITFSNTLSRISNILNIPNRTLHTLSTTRSKQTIQIHSNAQVQNRQLLAAGTDEPQAVVDGGAAVDGDAQAVAESHQLERGADGVLFAALDALFNSGCGAGAAVVVPDAVVVVVITVVVTVVDGDSTGLTTRKRAKGGTAGKSAEARTLSGGKVGSRGGLVVGSKEVGDSRAETGEDGIQKVADAGGDGRKIEVELEVEVEQVGQAGGNGEEGRERARGGSGGGNRRAGDGGEGGGGTAAVVVAVAVARATIAGAVVAVTGTVVAIARAVGAAIARTTVTGSVVAIAGSVVTGTRATAARSTRAVVTTRATRTTERRSGRDRHSRHDLAVLIASSSGSDRPVGVTIRSTRTASTGSIRMLATGRDSDGRRSNGHIDGRRLNVNRVRLLGRNADLDRGAVGKEDGEVDAADVVGCGKNRKGGETGDKVQSHFE